MSAITNVNNSSSLIYPASQASLPDSTDDSTAGASIVTPANGSQQSNSTGSTTTSPLGDLRTQIETAVTNAVSQLPAGSSPQDILSSVRSAVEDTLKANGLDPQQIRGHGGHGGHHHHAHGAGGGSLAASTDPDGDGDQQNAADPLLAAVGSSPENPVTPQPAITGANPSSSSSLLALFASGPGAANALTTLLQQLSGASTAGGQSNSGGNQSSSANPLLSALQNNNNNSNGLDLTAVFQQLFQGFPNGTALDVQI
jgi:hypothetical protein